MQFQFITFGNGEVLKGVLDAIAMCLNAETGTLYIPMLRVGMMVAVLWMAMHSIWGDYLKVWGKGLIPFVFIPPLLFAPSVTVNIYDAATNYRDRVDHVPLGLAYLGHFVSQFGYEVTKQVDQVFAQVDDLKYHKSGFLMASNLIQQAKTFRISNEDVAENMRQFVVQCVAYEAMLGYKYTLEDLRHASDLWGLVSAHPSKIRSFLWREPHAKDGPTRPPEIVSCFEGVRRFNHLWGIELDRAKGVLGGKLFASRNPLRAKQEFIKYLPLSYGFLSGLSKSADEILKQQMMIHSLVDGIEQKSVSLGNAPNFAAKRAYLQQRSTYETLGAMASESLLAMKAVLEVIVYAAFIFVVPLAVLPFGVKILLSWAQTLLWLQMWAPLYAVLNFAMSMAAQTKSMGMLSTSNPDGVTIASSVGLANLNADMAAMAGFLAMGIPFLAIALIKGVGSFVHLASHLGNVSQGAASQAAGEAVTGNYSFGNVSTGNEQIGNTNMLSYSRAASYRAGAFQFLDGRTDITTMGDGSQILNIGTSKIPISPHISAAISAQSSKMATETHQKGLALSESSSKNLASSYRDMASLSEALATNEAINDGVTQGVSVEQLKAIQKAAQLISGVDNDHQIATDKSATGSAEASIGGGLIVKGSVGARLSTSVSDQDILRNIQKYSEDEQFQNAMREAAQAAKNISHTVSDETSKRLATEVSGSYETGMAERAEAQKNFTESIAWNQQAMNTRTNAATINAAYDQQFVEWLAAQPADNATGRIGISGAADIIANRPKEAMAYADKFVTQYHLVPEIPLVNPQQIRSGYNSDTGHNVYTVTKDPIHAVNKEGSMLKNNVKEDGEKIRCDVSHALDANDQAISREVSTISQGGAEIEQKVRDQQGCSVAVQMGKKVAAEGIGTLTDIYNTLPDGDEVLKKLKDQEPQQK